jgi:hypothetical protein
MSKNLEKAVFLRFCRNPGSNPGRVAIPFPLDTINAHRYRKLGRCADSKVYSDQIISLATHKTAHNWRLYETPC